MESSVYNQNVDISALFTMALPVTASHYFVVTTVDELKDALTFCKSNGYKPVILGGGSNVLPAAQLKCVIKLGIQGVEWSVQEEGAPSAPPLATARVGAGVTWDDFVLQSCKKGFYDLAALSAIPGLVGATPVQNVGAYGTEICDHMINLEVLDIETGEIKTIQNNECGFAYRTSNFKTVWAGNYIVTHVTFRFSQTALVIPNYPGVSDEIETLPKPITPLTIRQAITTIRWRKLPKPSELPNCGSFFHNPIISKQQYDELKKTYADMPGHVINDETIKVPAGWLIQQVGFKGVRRGNFGTSPDNALVVVHYGGGSRDELLQFADEIINAVKAKFDITINREPLLLD